MYGMEVSFVTLKTQIQSRSVSLEFSSSFALSFRETVNANSYCNNSTFCRSYEMQFEENVHA